MITFAAEFKNPEAFLSHTRLQSASACTDRHSLLVEKVDLSRLDDFIVYGDRTVAIYGAYVPSNIWQGSLS